MKRITVVRHAEAGQASSDFERRLTAYGQAQAESTAAQLQTLIKPQLIVVSTSHRTRETAEFFISEFGSSVFYKYDSRLYEASTEELRRVIRELSEDVSEILLVGHNPSISSLVSSWADSYVGFSTACATVLEIDADTWSESVYKSATIVSKVLPRK